VTEMSRAIKLAFAILLAVAIQTNSR